MSDFSTRDEAFRDEVRRFLDAELGEDLRKVGRETTGVFTEWPLARPWHEILYRRGWAAPSWPKEYGGTGWSVVEQYIFASELAAAEAPKIPVMSLRMVGPVVMRFGRDDQKVRYLPKILSGEDFWCQGYSEPGAGSDLAALSTRAVSDGDDYIVNGTKIWTTHAQWANRIFCLVRTAASGKPQAGITFLLVDMDTPGITVEPIITMAGDHEVNQVFFDDVRVPKANRLGEENEGWTVAKYLLEYERSVAHAAAIRAELAHVVRLAQADALWGHAEWRTKLAEVEISLDAYQGIEHRILSAASRGESPGPGASILKVMFSELTQRVTELGTEIIGYRGLPTRQLAQPARANVEAVVPPEVASVMPRYLNARATTIFGGTNEVQRNLLAKLVLGL